jgi:hypothetical protein
VKDYEWVALETFTKGDTFYESGGIYAHKGHVRYMNSGRPYEPGEHIAECPRCGQRFAATDDGTAESHRDLHFHGDDDVPSICLNMPTGRFKVVEKKGGTR